MDNEQLELYEASLMHMAQESKKQLELQKKIADNMQANNEELERTDKLTRVDLKLKTKNLRKGLAGVIQNIGEFNNSLANDIMYGLDLTGNSFTGFLKNRKVEEIATSWSNQTLDLSEQFKKELGDSFSTIKQTTFKNADLMKEIAKLQAQKANANKEEKENIEKRIKVLQDAKTDQEESLKLALAETANSTDTFTNFSNGFKKLTFGIVDIGGALDAGMEWVNAIKDVGGGLKAGLSFINEKFDGLFGLDKFQPVKTPEEQAKDELKDLGKEAKKLGETLKSTNETMVLASELDQIELEKKEENLELLDEENKQREKSHVGWKGLIRYLGIILPLLAFVGTIFAAWKNENFGAIGSALRVALEKTTEKIGQWGDDLAKWGAKAGEKFTGVIDDLGSKITNSKLYTKIFGAADDVAKPGLLSRVGGAIKNTATKAAQTIASSPVGQAVGNVVTKAKEMGTAVVDKGSKWMGNLAKAGKWLVKKAPIIGAIAEGYFDLKRINEDYKQAKTLYEMGELMVPEDPENPDSAVRPMNSSEWADFEKAISAAKTGSFGRTIGAITGQAAAAALGLFSGGLGLAAGGVALSMGGSYLGDKLATSLAGGDEAYQAVQNQLRGNQAISTPVEEIQAQTNERDELYASGQSGQTNNNINNVVSEVNTSNFNSGGQYLFKDAEKVGYG